MYTMDVKTRDTESTLPAFNNIYLVCLNVILGPAEQ